MLYNLNGKKEKGGFPTMAKRIFALMLVLAMAFSIAACNEKETGSEPTTSSEAVQTVTSGDEATDDKTK